MGICIFKSCQSHSASLLCSCFKDKFYAAEPAADAATQEKCLNKASKRSTWQVDIFSSAGDRSTSSFSHGKRRRKVAKKVAERRKEEADPLVSGIPKRVGRKREIEAGKYDIAPGLLGCVWRRGWREQKSHRLLRYRVHDRRPQKRRETTTTSAIRKRQVCPQGRMRELEGEGKETRRRRKTRSDFRTYSNTTTVLCRLLLSANYGMYIWKGRFSPSTTMISTSCLPHLV